MGNTAVASTGRTYLEIVAENAFSFINFTIFGLAIVLAVLGRPLDAVLSCIAISFNIIIGIVQEVRAKRTLDAIALLTRPQALVIRDGSPHTVQPTALVLGDVLSVAPGDQVVVDGRVLQGHLQVDESQLTGESAPISKNIGDEVFSGSFCVSGGGQFEAIRVGADCFVNQVVSGARARRRILTPLQRLANVVIRILLVVVMYFQFLLVLSALISDRGLAMTVENAALLAGLIPNGLLVSITLSYALAAVKVSAKGALVQQTNAIESLSNVNILCLDKTGTLTTNRLQVDGVQVLFGSQAALETALGAFAAGMDSGNQTALALAQAYPGQRVAGTHEITFSSTRKWSALALPGDGVYVLGAPEMLGPALAPGSDFADIDARVRASAGVGLRVLLFAHAADLTQLEDAGDDTRLPIGMRALGLVLMRDELRPEAQSTLNAFIAAGVQPKIISGDSTETVAALARQAGLSVNHNLISGLALADMDEAQFAEAARNHSIFGRITPQQKERLVRALQAQGNYVAMIGDGVNDVLSLKTAQVGIAMQSGSQATRGVADIVLTDDSFAALVPAVLEGQRIINGMHAILRLFLTRILTVTMVILPIMMVGTFPLSLRHASLIAMLVAGIPSTMLALWARPGPVETRGVAQHLLRFVIPPTLVGSTLAIIIFAVVALGVFVMNDVQLPDLLINGPLPPAMQALMLEARWQAQSALTAFLTFCGLFLLLFLEPPTLWWASGSPFRGERRPAMLGIGLCVLYIALSHVSFLQAFYGLVPLAPWVWLVIAAGILAWVLLVRWCWRANLLERFLDAPITVAR